MEVNPTRYVSAWTSCILREEPRKNSRGLTQCLWGDWVGLRGLEPQRGWYNVRTRGRGGFLHEDDLTEERPLEVNFVDIGQGDGTFIVTPDDKMILVDSGERDNMYRFLKWRFNMRPNSPAPRIDCAIITHPDQDHYKGFQKLFDDGRFHFGTVFHNGIVERASDDRLGNSVVKDGQRYLTDLVRDKARLIELLEVSANRGRMSYPKLLWTGVSNGRVDDFRMLAAGDEVFPSRQLYGKWLTMKSLAPVTEDVDGTTALRWFGDKPGTTGSGDVGKTKNGHSVVTLLKYGQIKILLGGDLNIPAEAYLLDHYGFNTKVFEADVAKACHHGSADFSPDFLDRVRAHATVICSGDDEPHGHPRADTLGTVGKHSRGERSLIFSTELARSAPERIVDERGLRDEILKLADRMADAEGAEREKRRESLKRKLSEEIRRSVAVYGMITLRTDGNRVLMAQRLERTTTTRKWDMYPMERVNGVLTFVSKH